MTTEQKLEKAAEQFILHSKNLNYNRFKDQTTLYFIQKDMEEFVKSEAAREYWYKQFEKEKLEFAIEQLKSLEPTDYDIEYSSADLRYFRNELRKRRIELEQKLKKIKL